MSTGVPGPDDAPTVLVVDDERAIRRSMEVTLGAQGYRVITAADGEGALTATARGKPDVVVLDLGLPGISGQEVILGIRGWSLVPIIVLSARDADAEKVTALDNGANDYVTKPFSMEELSARIRAAVRWGSERAAATEAPVVTTDDFTIDLVHTRVTRGGEEVRLTPTEWHLLEVLVRNAGRLVTRETLLTEVWGPTYATQTNYLRVFMAQLRAKLEPDPSHPRYLITESGLGSRFEP
jgi:two-component system KDP operon response regulator KdpE